jgi:hypothetical protein
MGTNCHGPDTGTAASVWNAERFVEIEMTDVCPEAAGTGDTNERVQVCAVKINLSACVVYRCADFADGLFENSVGRRVGNH